MSEIGILYARSREVATTLGEMMADRTGKHLYKVIQISTLAWRK